MSRFDYGQSRQLACADYSFESLIMAAYWRADSQNAALLRADWPEIVEELQARCNATPRRMPKQRRAGRLPGR
jgi:hypothetical protein